MHLQPFSRHELIALARRLACERFAPRADRHDCAASFPFDDYADLRTEGLLGLCVPDARSSTIAGAMRSASMRSSGS
jgi:hypothetical protein